MKIREMIQIIGPKTKLIPKKKRNLQIKTSKMRISRSHRRRIAISQIKLRVMTKWKTTSVILWPKICPM